MGRFSWPGSGPSLKVPCVGPSKPGPAISNLARIQPGPVRFDLLALKSIRSMVKFSIIVNMLLSCYQQAPDCLQAASKQVFALRPLFLTTLTVREINISFHYQPNTDYSSIISHENTPWTEWEIGKKHAGNCHREWHYACLLFRKEDTEKQ